jgi:hypothetical protein
MSEASVMPRKLSEVTAPANRLRACAGDSRYHRPVSDVQSDPAVSGRGWAIQRVGPWVLGVWNAPMTEDRVLECARLYRRAHRLHGRLSVFSRHRENPFPVEMLAAQRSREMVISLLREFGDHFGVFVVGIEGSGFQASLMRLGAAAVVHGVRRATPLVFVSSLAEGLREAQLKGSVHGIEVATLEEHMRELDALAAL